MVDHMMTAKLDATCTCNDDDNDAKGALLAPLLMNNNNSMYDEATAKEPVPNKSRWYCIPGKIKLISMPRRLTRKMTMLYRRNGDTDVSAAAADDKRSVVPSNNVVVAVVAKEADE